MLRLCLLALLATLGSDALVFPVERRAARLALVIPFTERDSGHVIANLKRWQEGGDPCPTIRKFEAKHYVDIIFWFNMDFHANETFADNFRLEARHELKWMRSCFGRSKFLSSHLTAVEDAYPQGPSNQFYRLFGSSVEGLSGARASRLSHADLQPCRYRAARAAAPEPVAERVKAA